MPGGLVLHSYDAVTLVDALRSSRSLTREAEAWVREEEGLWRGGSFSSPGRQDGVQRRGSKMDRQAERDGLGPAGQVSAKPLPLSHHLATYSLHPFSDCAHCLAWMRQFYGCGDLVMSPVNDGSTSQAQSSGEAVLTQPEPGHSSINVGPVLALTSGSAAMHPG